ncbi:MAG: protein kinase [Candidatus Promineifilaceae bacterium]|nr:protein kinase [Candidatus Promineifilaceae bacterium]
MAKHQLDRYQLEAEIGRGGMGTVYRAYDPRFQRRVAIKVLPPQFTHDPNFRARFDNEALLVARLEHSAIVPIYDFGEEDGWPYFVMRLMRGGTLADRLQGDQQVATTAVDAIARRVAAALDKAHANQIIHRDVKPGNILFDEEGEAYLADFGIARLADMTQTVTMIGTSEYMSPEQVRGETLDHRVDIYQLGVVLFQALTGDVPFSGNTAAVLHAHVYDPVPSLAARNSALPPDVDGVIAKAMAKAPQERYQSAGALAARLERALSASPLTEIVAPPLEEERRQEAEPAATPDSEGVADPEGAAEREPQPAAQLADTELMPEPVGLPDAPPLVTTEQLAQAAADSDAARSAPAPAAVLELAGPAGQRLGQLWTGLSGGRRFWAQWTLVTAAALAIGGPLASWLSRWLHWDMELAVPAEWLYLNLLAGLVLGLAQWRLLRRYLARSGWWVLLTMLAWPVGAQMGSALRDTLFRRFYHDSHFFQQQWYSVLFAVVMILGIGLFQWLWLRRYARVPARWLLAWAGAGLVYAFIGPRLIHGPHTGELFKFGLGFGLFGLTLGVLTGPAGWRAIAGKGDGRPAPDSPFVIRSPGRMWVAWTVVTGLAWLAAYLLGLRLNIGLSWEGWRPFTSFVFHLVLGLVLGATQWTLLDAHLPRAGRWIWLTALGELLGHMPKSYLGFSGSTLYWNDALGFMPVGELWGSALAGLLIGLFQWRLLRPLGRLSRWWISLFTGLYTLSAGVLRFWIESGPGQPWSLPWFWLNLGLGLLLGVGTGALLVRLLPLGQETEESA